MKKKEIYDLFKKLKITEKMLSEYKDPHTFAENIKKCSILTPGRVTYSTGTGCIREESNAKLE